MSPVVQVVVSGCLSFGIPLLIAVYELRSLRRGGGPGGDWRAPGPPAPPKPLPQGGAKPLPACLVPNAQWRAPAPAPVRLPELV